MKTRLLVSFVTLIAIAAMASAAPMEPKALEKRVAPVLKALALGDEASQAKAKAATEIYFQAIQAWHDANDAKLAELWKLWAEARSPDHKDEAKAASFGTQIDELYATFKPQHDAFLAALAEVATPAQIEAVKDALTRSPGLGRTYNAYLEMVPALTEPQRKWIHEKLEVAREQAMDTFADKEKVNLFKKQKVKIEAYIDEQGYDYHAAFKAFANKGKEKEAAAKAAKEKAKTQPAETAK